jgi:hypothetical protein
VVARLTIEKLRAFRAPPALWLLVPPLAVFALSATVFSLTAFGIDDLVATITREWSRQTPSIDRFAEIHARLSWAATIVIVYCTFIAAGVYSARVVGRRGAAKGRFVVIMAGLVAGSLVLAYFAYSGQAQNNFGYIFLFTYDTLAASRIYSDAQLQTVRLLLFGLNALAGAVPILGLITAGCCVLAPSTNASSSEVEDLKSQMRELKTLVGMGSTLMVAGVLHMVVWLQWPAALVQDVRMSGAISNFSQAMGLYWGATFSLVIAAFYLPAARGIHRRAEASYRTETDEPNESGLQEWLKRNGLALAPAQQMPPLLAMFAPLLAEPIGSMLAKASVSSIVGG